MRLNNTDVIVQLIPPEELSAAGVAYHAGYNDFFNKWNGKEGTILTYSRMGEKYLFLVQFEKDMETFTHDQLIIHPDEMKEWVEERKQMDAYRIAREEGEG